MMASSKFIAIISVVYVLGVVLAACSSYWLVIPPSVIEIPDQQHNLDKPAKAALNLSADMIKLLLTLATGLISVCIWVLTRPLTDGRELIERTAGIALALFAFCLSLYFGYIALHRAVIMASLGGFDPRLDLVWWPQSLQYYAFIAGAVVLGLSCIRSLNAITERRN